MRVHKSSTDQTPPRPAGRGALLKTTSLVLSGLRPPPPVRCDTYHILLLAVTFSFGSGVPNCRPAKPRTSSPAGLSECVCSPGYAKRFRDGTCGDSHSLTDEWECALCPPGGNCLGNNIVLAREGFWADRDVHGCVTLHQCRLHLCHEEHMGGGHGAPTDGHGGPAPAATDGHGGPAPSNGSHHSSSESGISDNCRRAAPRRCSSVFIYDAISMRPETPVLSG